EVDPAVAWQRVRGRRPLAQDEQAFYELYERRRPLYEEVADGPARDADEVVLAAAGIHVGLGALRHGQGLSLERPAALVYEPPVAPGDRAGRGGGGGDGRGREDRPAGG